MGDLCNYNNKFGCEQDSFEVDAGLVNWIVLSRYTRVKQDNAALTARIHMLEEHIRELEVLCYKKTLLLL